MKALLLVDIRNDFVPDGDKVIPVANQLQPLFPLAFAGLYFIERVHG